MARIGARGGDRLRAILAQLADAAGKNVSVRVGFQDGATYPAPEGANPVFIAQVAFWNEYGTTKSPPRPFFRTMIARRSERWPDMIATLIDTQNYEPAKIMAFMGERLVNELRDSIKNGGWAPNADETVERKGFAKPLIDTSRMYDEGISYEVIEE